MAGGDPPPSGQPEPRQGQDRDTEPIPRARVEHGPPEPPEPRAAESVRVTTTTTTARGTAPVGPSPIFEDEEFGGLRGDTTPTVPSSGMVALVREPSTMVERYLFVTEKFRGEWRRHWIQLIKVFLVGGLATVIAGYGAGILAKYDQPDLVMPLAVCWFIVMVILAWKILDWWFDRFILTNKRVMVVSGIITKKVAMMPLLRVTDMKYEQPFWGRLLGYGHFELESAGQDQALRNIRNLPNPNELYLQIVEEMYEPESVEARLSQGQAEDGDGT